MPDSDPVTTYVRALVSMFSNHFLAQIITLMLGRPPKTFPMDKEWSGR
jgi:hypothetical protein